MRPEERRRKIVDLVREHRRVSVEFLAELLDLSRETIRRDLTDLADRGEVVKYHGGASFPDGGSEGSFDARLLENTAQKRAIARQAAALFQDGDSLFIDTGTTTQFFAEELAVKSGLTIITNSAAIAHTVTVGGRNDAYLIGGQYRPDASECLGPLVLEQLDRFRPRHAVITVGAMGTDGMRDFALDEAAVAKAMIARANCLTVIADTAKLGRAAMFPICPLDRVQRLVTGRLPAGEFLQAVRAAGIDLIEAAPDRM